jgi:hypothetical protein
MRKYNNAINIALSVVGEQLIENDVPIEGIYEAEVADLLIETTKTEILEEGWSFNTDENWEMLPDVNGYIVIPTTALRIDASSTDTNVIRKDGKLYDKDNQTYIFESSVECDVVWDVDFDDLPTIMKSYITLKASRILYQRLVGDADMLNILIKDEQEALLRVRNHEDDIKDVTIFDNSQVARILTRNSNPTGIIG